jgi:hypothetical protein
MGVFVVVLLGVGCGRGKPAADPSMGGMNRIMGEQLGQRIAEDVGSGGDIILVHKSTHPGGIKAWVTGLTAGASAQKMNVVEYGPAQLSKEAMGSMGGFACLREAMDQFPDAAALVTAISIGAFENPQFPAEHPPVYALDWTDVRSSLFLFRDEDIQGGVFIRPDYNPTASSANLGPQELYDETYVLVTADNVREVVQRYPR